MKVFVVPVFIFVCWMIYTLGYYNGKTDIILEMRDLFKGCQLEE